MTTRDDWLLKDNTVINIVVQLAPALASQLDLLEIETGLVQDLSEILMALGIPGKPLVEVVSSQESAAGTDTDKVLSVWINGRPCACPIRVARLAYEYLADEDFHGGRIPAGILDLVRELPPERVGVFVRLTCTEIVRLRPASLLTEESAAAYQAVLEIESNEDSIIDAPSLRALLGPVLDLRISVADTTKVAHLLSEGSSQQRSSAAISEGLLAELRPDTIEVQLPASYLKEITLNIPEDEQGNFALMRDGLFYELGARFPAIRLVPTESLRTRSFRFKVNDLVTLPWKGLRTNEVLVSEEQERLRLLGVQGQAAINPANMSSCSIIDFRDAPLAEAAGLTTWNQFGFLILALSAELRSHAACFMDISQLNRYLSDLGQAFPMLVEVVRKHGSLETTTQALRQLLVEQVSIRNLRQILEGVTEFVLDDNKHRNAYPVVGDPSPNGEDWSADAVAMAMHVRTKLKRQISHKHVQRDDTLVVYLLDDKIDGLLANDPMTPAESPSIQLDAREQDAILAAVRSEIGSQSSIAQRGLVLTTLGARSVFRELISLESPDVSVICYEELAPDLNVQPVGRISLQFGA